MLRKGKKILHPGIVDWLSSTQGVTAYQQTILDIKALLGSKLVALYDAKAESITVDSSNNVSQLDDLSGNGYHLTQSNAANRPKWNELDTIYYVSGSQEFLSNNSIIPALQGNSVGVFGIQQAVTSTQFLTTFAQSGGTNFMGLRNNGATFIWGGTGSTGTTTKNAGNNNLKVLYGLQVNNDVDINTMVGTTIDTYVDTTISMIKDIASLNTMYVGTNGQATPTYYTFFQKTLCITNGNISTTDLATLAGLLLQLDTAWETVFVAELGQSNMEGRDGDSANGKYPFQIGKGREWTGSSDIEIKTTRGDGAVGTGSHANYFAAKYYELTGKVAIMAECAEGGTGLTATSSATNWSAGSTLRGLAETKIDSGLTNYSKALPDFALWCQGERDAQEMDSTPAYTKAIVKAAMQDVIDWWQTTYPGVPFVISELGRLNDGSPETQGWTDMRAIQNEIAAENSGVYIGFSGAKDFKDAGKMIDSLHYDYVGYQEMGEALATYCAGLI